MSAWATSLPLFAVAGLIALAIGALVGGVAAGLLRRRVASCAPRHRHRALLGLASVPVLLAATLLLSASLPAFIALVVPGMDHCTVHDDGHAHLCFSHAPHGVSRSVLALLVLAGSLGVTRLAAALVRIRRTRRVLDALLASGEADSGLGVTIVESPLPICMAAGFLRPRVLIARGLLESLPAEQQEIVLTHERTHLERHDALALAVARVLCTFHLPPVRRWLLRELSIAAEQACDEAAALRVDDRVAVAATILSVQRAWTMRGTPVGAAGLGFAMHALERRVEALLAEPRLGRGLTVHGWCSIAIALLVLAASGSLHHWTESLVSHLAL